MKDTGGCNLPFRSFAANRIWLALVTLAMDLIAWTQILAFADHPARRWEVKILRLRLFSIPARLVRHARRVHLRVSAHHPWAGLVLTAFGRVTAPDQHQLPLQPGKRITPGPWNPAINPLFGAADAAPNSKNNHPNPIRPPDTPHEKSGLT